MGTFRCSSAVVVLVVAGCHHDKPPAPLPPLPRSAYAHYLDGKLAMYEKHYDIAVGELAAAAAAAPDEPMIVVELARAQAKSGAAPAAKDTLAKARLRWPDRAEIWEISGELLAATAPDEAAGDYRRAIELAPDDEHAYLGLAHLETDRNRSDAAERTLRDLVDHVPASVDGHYRLAQRLAARGDMAAAIVQLRAVLERDPDHIDGRVDLARALRRQGHLAAAIAETRGAFDRSGQDLELAEELFWLLCESDDRQAAIDLLTLLDDDGAEVSALALVARLDRGLGRLVDAREIAERIAKRDPDAGAVALAEVLVAEGEPVKAAATALTVGSDAKAFATARRVAAEANLAAGTPKLAFDALAPVRATKPRDATLAGLAAIALADDGAVAAGRALLAELRAAAKDDLAVQLAQARFEDHVGFSAAAVAILENVIRMHPEDGAALNQAGYLLVDSNQRLDVAERYLSRARILSPGEPAVLDSWGWMLLRTRRVRDAIRALAQAARFAPREPEILYHLASAWAADGSPKTARDVLDRAAGLSPSPTVAKRIADLRQALARER